MSVHCPMCSIVVYQTGSHRPTNRHAAPHQNRHVSSRFSLTLFLLLFVCSLPIAHLPLPNDYCLLPITNCPSKQEKRFSITLFLFVCLLLFCSLDFTSKDVTQSEIWVCNRHRHIFLSSWPQSSFRVVQVSLFYLRASVALDKWSDWYKLQSSQAICSPQFDCFMTEVTHFAPQFEPVRTVT